MSNKLFTIAGTSTLNGVNTYRFATGKVNVRVSKLKLGGHTDIALAELPEPMTKADAITFLNTLGSGAANAVLPKAGRSKRAALVETTAAVPAVEVESVVDVVGETEATAAVEVEQVAELTAEEKAAAKRERDNARKRAARAAKKAAAETVVAEAA